MRLASITPTKPSHDEFIDLRTCWAKEGRDNSCSAGLLLQCVASHSRDQSLHQGGVPIEWGIPFITLNEAPGVEKEIKDIAGIHTQQLFTNMETIFVLIEVG